MKKYSFIISGLLCLLSYQPTTAAEIDNEATSNTSIAETKSSNSIFNYVTKPKFSGYLVGKYDYNDQGGQTSNGGFALRFIRLSVEGDCFTDFHYRLQMEASGEPGTNKGVRVLDAYAEWQKYKWLRVKLGQFKVPFTFENPMNPWNVGFGSYTQLTTKLSGMSDRVGQPTCGGRDLGLQVQGDLFPIASDKHTLLHYQVGVFNGQGINYSDKNKSKDIIGGLWLNPIKQLSIGAFGWNGEYTSGGKTVDRNRIGLGAKYDGEKFNIRGEYVTSEGACATSDKCDKADAWYASAGIKVSKKVQFNGRWDCYRDNKEWNSLKTIWGASASYTLCKNLMFQANYYFTDDRANTNDKHYNTVDIEVYARF